MGQISLRPFLVFHVIKMQYGPYVTIISEKWRLMLPLNSNISSTGIWFCTSCSQQWKTWKKKKKCFLHFQITRKLYFQESPPVSSTAGRQKEKSRKKGKNKMTKFHNVVNAVQFIRAVKVNGMKIFLSFLNFYPMCLKTLLQLWAYIIDPSSTWKKKKQEVQCS